MGPIHAAWFKPLWRLRQPQAQKVQELDPVLPGSEGADQSVRLYVISTPHVPHAASAVIGGPVLLQSFARTDQASSPSRLQVEWPEFVYADDSPVNWRMLVQPPNGPVFGPELRGGEFLPGLGVPLTNLALPQDLTEPADADGTDDLLLDEIVAQLGQRPAIHADQSLGRRQGDFDDLFGDVGEGLYLRMNSLTELGCWCAWRLGLKSCL